MINTIKADRRETIWLAVKTLAVIFVSELIVMVLLHTLVPKVPSSSWDIIVDPVLMIVLSVPILYWVLIKPIWSLLRQRTWAVEALSREKSRAQQYLDIAGVMLVAFDRDGRVTLINKKGCEILGYEESEILGRNWFESFVPDAEIEQVRACFEKLIGDQAMSVEYCENPVLTKSLVRRTITWHPTVLWDADGNATGVLSSGEDVTERRRMEEALRKHREHLEQSVLERTKELTEANRELAVEVDRRKVLEREILSIGDRERLGIGQGLHDSIGQQLTGIELMIDVLGEKLASNSLSEESLYAKKIKRYVERAVEVTHNLAKGLAPMDLERDGLPAGLQDLAAFTKELFDVSCVVTCDGAVSTGCISGDICLYRIAQEAITNAVRHAKARNIRVGLRDGNRSVVLTVENDGLDFPAELHEGAGLGLKIMRYRAELLNGSLDICRGAHGGALLTCVLPVSVDSS